MNHNFLKLRIIGLKTGSEPSISKWPFIIQNEQFLVTLWAASMVDQSNGPLLN